MADGEPEEDKKTDVGDGVDGKIGSGKTKGVGDIAMADGEQEKYKQTDVGDGVDGEI